MHAAHDLISGYKAYARAAELTDISSDAPAFSPASITVSSPECVAFSIGVGSGAITSAAHVPGTI